MESLPNTLLRSIFEYVYFSLDILELESRDYILKICHKFNVISLSTLSSIQRQILPKFIDTSITFDLPLNSDGELEHLLHLIIDLNSGPEYLTPDERVMLRHPIIQMQFPIGFTCGNVRLKRKYWNKNGFWTLKDIAKVVYQFYNHKFSLDDIREITTQINGNQHDVAKIIQKTFMRYFLNHKTSVYKQVSQIMSDYRSGKLLRKHTKQHPHYNTIKTAGLYFTEDTCVVMMEINEKTFNSIMKPNWSNYREW